MSKQGSVSLDQLYTAAISEDYELLQSLLNDCGTAPQEVKNIVAYCSKGDNKCLQLMFTEEKQSITTNMLLLLMIASKNSYGEVVKRLLENGAQVDLQKRDGWSALMIASETGHGDVVKLLLENGAQVNLQKEDGESALMIASENGHGEVVRILLENGAQVDLQNQDGVSALMLASQNGHVKVVKKLIEKGAWVDQQTSSVVFSKTTSLTKPNEIIQLMRYDSHDVNNFSPLKFQSNELVTILLQNGSQLKLHGLSVVVSAQERHDGVVKILLQHNAKKYHVKSLSLFEYKFSTSDNFEKILKMGASDMSFSYGMSALMLAAMYGHDEVVKTLLDCRAKLDLITENGWSSLMFASQNGHKGIVNTLLSKGAQVNLRNRQNQTALMLAQEAKEYYVTYFWGTRTSSNPLPLVSRSNISTYSTRSPFSRGGLSRDSVTCPVCEEIIPDASKAEQVQDLIFCAGKCATWLHRQCAGLSVSAFKLLDNSEEPYLCPNCELDAQKIEMDDLKKQIADLRSVVEQKVTLPTTNISNSSTHSVSSPSSSSASSHRFSANILKFNIVMYGIAESPEGTKKPLRDTKDLESVEEVIRVLDSSLDAKSVRDCFRLGKFSRDKFRPILVKFTCARHASPILSNSGKLAENEQYKKISIKRDMSKLERQSESLLLKERFLLINSGIPSKDIKLKENQLFVNDKVVGSIVDRIYKSVVGFESLESAIQTSDSVNSTS